MPAHIMHARKDRGLDSYPTPPEALLALMAAEPLPQRLWEPACGAGNLVKVLRAQGRGVLASDVVPDDLRCEGSERLDFMAEEAAKRAFEVGVDAIVTNPPFFMLAKGWVERCLTLVPDVYLLCRLQFLEGSSGWRRQVLERSGLRRVYVFRDRLPMMHRAGWDGPKSTSTTAFAWFCWRGGWTGLTSVKRISWKEAGPPLPPKGKALPRTYCRQTIDMFPTKEMVR